MMKKYFCKKNFFLLGTLFVLMLFAYITFKTPLTGDDWGYAINGSAGTPIKTALEFYRSWSGRFFSELWGMIVPLNKWIWNIVNPILFAGSFVCIYKLANVNNRYVLIPLFIIAFMLSIDDNLRMETYTWIMGTTYIVPLFFSLVYFLLIDKMFNKEIKPIWSYLSNILLFIIGLMMENIAATMIVAIVVLLIYAWINEKHVIKYLIVNLLFSVLSFVILRMSPGSASRLVNDNATWVNMNLFEKLGSAYPNFLQISFINNNYAISLFSIVLILLAVLSKTKVKVIYKVASSLISILGIITVFYFVVGDNFINDASSIYSMVFWPLYVINAFVVICLFVDSETKEKAIFFLMVAGCSVLAMLYSPIYGSRSAIYLVYYLILVSVILLDKVDIKKELSIIFAIGLLIIIGDRTYEYVYKYRLVGIKQQERLEIIKYYQEHPEDEEAWIPRFPICTIHGADIEPDDTYHLETFKEYYHLPQDADKIIFYFMEEE